VNVSRLNAKLLSDLLERNVETVDAQRYAETKIVRFGRFGAVKEVARSEPKAL
jgi:hypothetical protein